MLQPEIVEFEKKTECNFLKKRIIYQKFQNALMNALSAKKNNN